MPKKTIYCGINKLSKDERYGNMEECAKKKQVRRYGIYKADTRIVNAAKNSPKDRSRDDVIIEYATLKGIIGKLNKDILGEKKEGKKKVMIKQKDEMMDKIKLLSAELKGEVDQKSTPVPKTKLELLDMVDSAIISNKSDIERQKMDLDSPLSKTNNEYIASYQGKLPGKISKMKKLLDQIDMNNEKIRKLSKSQYTKAKMADLVNKADLVDAKYNKLAYENLLEEGIKSYYDMLVQNPFFQNDKEILSLMGKLKQILKVNMELANKYPKDRHFIALKRFQDHLLVQAQSKEFFSKNSMEGGSLMNKYLRQFIQESHKSDMSDVGDYKIDKSLSSKWVKVYYNAGKKQCVVVHRGSSDGSDAWVDTKLLFQQKNNERFKVSEQTQKKAEKKYGAKNVTTVGSSLGGYLAEQFGANSKEIITISKPTTPLDALKGKKKHPNQYDVRNSKDAIASLQNFQKGKNDIIVTTDHYNPLKNHMGDDVLKELPDDQLIGKGIPQLIGKMPVKDLKALLKVLRQAHKAGPKDYPIVGKKKPELRNMILKLSTGLSGGSLSKKREATLWEKLNSMFAYNVAFPLFKALINKLEGGSSSVVDKLTNVQLKFVIKIMKKYDIGNSKSFNVLKKSRSELIDMINSVKKDKSGGSFSEKTGSGLWEDLNEKIAYNIVFPLFKMLIASL